MRWILCTSLLLALTPGSGNLQERLTHRVDHGSLITVLEIDRDVVLSRSESQLWAVLRVEPPRSETLRLEFAEGSVAEFTVEDSQGSVLLSRSWRLPDGVRERLVTRSGWEIRVAIPMRDGEGKSLPAGRHLLRVRLMSGKALENRIAFQVR